VNSKWQRFLYESHNGEQSAGVLLYKFRDGQYYVYLVHAGGPYNKNNPHAWGIPKGHYDEGLDDTLQDTASREFAEEVGIKVPGDLTFDLGQIKTASGKTVQAFAAEGDLPAGHVLSSNMVDKMIGGKMMTFPEVDEGKWFTIEEAYDIINKRQRDFIVALEVEMDDKTQKLSEELGTNSSKDSKAIFMAGGPGSGKGTLLSKIGAYDENMQVINTDDHFEPLLKAAGLSLDLDHPEREIRSQQGKLFVQAQNAAKEQTREFMKNRADIIIDGTAGSFINIRKAKERLEDAGYDVAMIYVDIPLEVSLARNEKRFEQGGRKVKPERVEKSWKAVNKNKEPYAGLFGSNFFYFDGGAEETGEQIADIKRKFISFISSQ
jgi:predicted NUDIX family NTP pyrophosphohydrolase/adenylate kinase family enzyme